MPQSFVVARNSRPLTEQRCTGNAMHIYFCMASSWTKYPGIKYESVYNALIMFSEAEPSVARLTQFEGRGHKKVPKGPPFAYVFEKISKTNYQRGEYWLFLTSPSILRGGHGPLAPPPKCATESRQSVCYQNNRNSKTKTS